MKKWRLLVFILGMLSLAAASGNYNSLWEWKKLQGKASPETMSDMSDSQILPQESWNVKYVGHIGGSISAVALQGDYAYIGEGYGLTILDISDPTSVGLVKRTPLFPDIVWGEDVDIVLGVDVAEEYAYVAGGEAGLRVVDISDPMNPTEVGFHDTPGSARECGSSGGLCLRGQIQMLACGWWTSPTQQTPLKSASTTRQSWPLM